MLTVESILNNLKINYSLISFDEAAYTVADVHRLAGEQLKGSTTVKTLIVIGKKTQRRYCFVLIGTDRLDSTKAKSLLGEAYSMADASTVMEVAQSEPGSVCPFLVTIQLYIDSKVFAATTINIGSGDHRFGINLPSEGLRKLKYQEVPVSS